MTTAVELLQECELGFALLLVDGRPLAVCPRGPVLTEAAVRRGEFRLALAAPSSAALPAVVAAWAAAEPELIRAASALGAGDADAAGAAASVVAARWPLLPQALLDSRDLGTTSVEHQVACGRRQLADGWLMDASATVA